MERSESADLPMGEALSDAAVHEPSQALSSDNMSDAPFAWGAGSAPSLPSADDEDGIAGNEFDADSAIGGMSAISSTMSVGSSVYERVMENGRSYHRYKQGKYPLPNDEEEQERLEIQHMLFMATLGGVLNLAPIKNPKHVLDIGTGTGVWAIEFAQQYPESSVLGTDLSPIQPLYIPPNCRFEIDDAEDEWVFSERFDYIHGRALLSCFTSPKAVFEQAYKALSPGGYFEMQDFYFPCKFLNDEIPPNSALYKWCQLVVAGSEKVGRPWNNVPHYARYMREIGFEDVVEKKFYWPFSPWAKGKYYKDLAVLVQQDALHAVEGVSLKVIGALGWTAEEIRAFIPSVKEDILNRDIHAYLPVVVAYGRKPLNAN